MRLIEIPDDGIIREYIYKGKDTIVGERRIDLSDYSTVDAVEVVRCKDCKHRPKVEEEHKSGFDIKFPDDYVCPCQCDDEFYNWMPNDDWYCANGERRTE